MEFEWDDNKNKLNQQQAIELLKNGSDLSGCSLEWNETKIEALDGILISKNGFSVPENLIFYDDASIDYSDDEGLTDEDLSLGAIRWSTANEAVPAALQTGADSPTKTEQTTFHLVLPCEIMEWIEAEEIHASVLISKLLCDFYETAKMFRHG